MVKSMELKLCPFCGSEAEFTENNRQIVCKDCNSGTWVFPETATKEDVLALWNSRPQNQKLHEVLKEIANDYARSNTIS